MTIQGGQGSQEDNVVLHLIGNLLTDQSNQSNQSSKGLKIFENVSVVGGSFLSYREMESFLRTSKATKPILGKPFKTSDVQPEDLTQKLGQKRQELREFYLRETSLHALTGHLAGSVISFNLNNFINNLGLEDVNNLIVEMRSLFLMAAMVEIRSFLSIQPIRSFLLVQPESRDSTIIKLIEKELGNIFFNAVRNQNSLLVKFLCAVGSNCPSVVQGLQKHDRYDRTVLMHAARQGNLDVVRALVGVGAPVNVQDENGCTALMHAASQGNLNVIRILIEVGADVNKRDRSGRTALMYARNSDVVETLIDAGADVNMRDRNGRTALMHVRDSDGVRALIVAGLGVNSQDQDGRTALMYARNSDVVETLINVGADINRQDQDGRTALMHIRDPNSLRVLIRAGADVNLQDQDQNTALIHAAGEDNSGLVQALLEAHQDVYPDVNIQGFNGQTALMIAAGNNDRLGALRALVAARADMNLNVDVDVQDDFGYTALMYAVLASNLEAVKILRGAGARVDLQNQEGMTAFTFASSEEIIAVLLEEEPNS